LEAREDCITRNFHNLYTSANIIKVIKSRRIRWAVHVARAREIRNT